VENKSSWITNGLLIVEIIAMVTIFFNIQGQIQNQGERSDKLYEMFVTVQNEIKDLHGRVCTIEERNRK
jgi:hypothetical protein